MKPLAAHSIASAAAILVIAAVSAAWIAHLRAGPKFGLEAGPLALMVPVALPVLGGLWLVLRPVLISRLRWGALGMTGVCAVVAYVIVAVTCGPIVCFQPGANMAMGWFLVGGVALAALVHHVVLGRLQKASLHDN